MFEFLRAHQSHMPYVAYDDHHNPLLLFCLKINDKWKAHYSHDGVSYHRLAPELPDDVTECSPYASYEDGDWHITLIAGGSAIPKYHRFALYIKHGLSAPPFGLVPAGYGFVEHGRFVYGLADNSIDVVRASNFPRWRFRFACFDRIYRLTCTPEDPNLLIITGKKDDNFRTVLFHIMKGHISEVLPDDTDAYKACRAGNRWFYARRSGPGFEDRHIVEAQKIDFRPLDPELVVTRNGVPFLGHSATIDIPEEYE